MRSSRLRRLALAATAVASFAALAATAAVGAPPAGKSSARQTLPGTKPAWTAQATPTAMVPASQQENAKVWLAPRNASGLASLAKAVSDPSSSQYRQYLSHAQYVAQFAPTSATVSAVTQWLKQSGLTVTSVGVDNHYVAVSGPASAMTTAFGAPLGLYSANGTQLAPTADFSVPSSVAGSVLGITGLATLGHQVVPTDLGAPAGFVNATPCSSYYGQVKATNLPKFQGQYLPYAPCGYTPSQLRGAYGVDQSGFTGTGVTVAITDAFDASTLQSDANTYATNHGDPAFKPGQFTDHSFPEGASSDPDPIASCGGNGWYGEQTLDVEAVHGMATGANVAYYGGASCYDDDLLAALAKVVSDNTASIVTNSWGEPTLIANLPQYGCTPTTPCLASDPSTYQAYESVFQQGAVQGIGFYFSSGDYGDEVADWGIAAPDYPAADPWVTAVGGTSLAIGNGNVRTWETGWGTSKWSLTPNGWLQTIPFQYGAGGGYAYLVQAEDGSILFQQPWWQQSLVSSPTGGRAVPDIAMDADPTTGMRIGETQNFALPSVFGPAGVHYGEYRIGGTSLASPLFAGVEAVSQQGAGRRIGFAAPLIYALKGQSNGASSFYDPKATGPDAGNVRSDYRNGYNADGGYVYSVRTFNQDSSLTTNKAWDDVTGVGTVTGRYISQVAGR